MFAHFGFINSKQFLCVCEKIGKFHFQFIQMIRNSSLSKKLNLENETQLRTVIRFKTCTVTHIFRHIFRAWIVCKLASVFAWLNLQLCERNFLLISHQLRTIWARKIRSKTHVTLCLGNKYLYFSCQSIWEPFWKLDGSHSISVSHNLILWISHSNFYQ